MLIQLQQPPHPQLLLSQPQPQPMPFPPQPKSRMMRMMIQMPLLQLLQNMIRSLSPLFQIHFAGPADRALHFLRC